MEILVVSRSFQLEAKKMIQRIATNEPAE